MSTVYKDEEIVELYSIQKVQSKTSTNSFNIRNYKDVDFESGSNSSMIFDSELDEFSKQMALAKRIMERNREVLKKLAK